MKNGLGSRTGSMSDLLVIKFIGFGKSQHPMNLGIKSSDCILFQMNSSYQDLWPIMNVNEDCSGSRAGI